MKITLFVLIYISFSCSNSTEAEKKDAHSRLYGKWNSYKLKRLDGTETLKGVYHIIFAYDKSLVFKEDGIVIGRMYDPVEKSYFDIYTAKYEFSSNSTIKVIGKEGEVVYDEFHFKYVSENELEIKTTGATTYLKRE